MKRTPLLLDEDTQVANTILRQLKSTMGMMDYLSLGMKKNKMSFGADQKFMGVKATGPGVQFDVRGHWKGRVIVRLDPSDTYSITFGRVRGSNWKVDKQVDGVYASSLAKVIKDNVLGNGIRK